MPADRSRRTDGLRDAYVGVVAQQGRVTLDRDVNAEHGYLSGRIRAEALDIFGPASTPDDGFAISIPAAGDPPLWTPPAPLPAPSNPPFDLTVKPGTMYVGGERAFLPGTEAGQGVGYGYFDQPDWAYPPPVGGADGQPPGLELVYLAVSEQEVSAVEDPDLLEVALGGPDTTQRLRLMRRIARQPVDASDCATAWDQATQAWVQGEGLALDPATMRLAPVARLQVSFAEDGGPADPCDPIVTSGYLGADNQTIRVQIADSGGANAQAQLLWGYDNASFLYRTQPLALNAAMLTIAPQPPDSFHVPQTGQVVEILRTAAVIAADPDMSDPTGQAQILRCVAEATGVIRRLVQPYGPATPGDPTAYMVLDQPLPAELLADKTPLFLRVWQSQIAFDAAGATVLLTDDVTGASTGVQVTLSAPAGEPLAKGAYWLISVRPATPQAVYPQRLLTAPQPPDGPQLRACPLAVIDRSSGQGTVVSDCRTPYGAPTAPVEAGCCCTVTVAPGGKLTLQQAIDEVAKKGGGVVCVQAGVHTLAAPLTFSPKHGHITVEGCGGGEVRIVAAKAAEADFGQGLVVVAGAPDVTLRGLTLAAARGALPGGATGNIWTMIGVHAADSEDLTVEACRVEFAAEVIPFVLRAFGAGVFAQGDCAGLTVQDCAFVSSLPVTFARPPAQANGTVGAPVSNLPASAVIAERLADSARDSLTALGDLSATTGNGSAAAAPAIGTSAMVALAGCLAMPTTAGTTPGLSAAVIRNPCRLGETVISGNRFEHLTLALYGVAQIDQLRLEDNEAVGGVGGYWLLFNDWREPVDAKSQAMLAPQWAAARDCTEVQVIEALALTFPKPAGPASPGDPPAPGPATLFVTGNQVEPAPITVNGTTALMLFANRAEVDGADTSASLIVANNRLRSRSGPQAPTALINTAQEERCAVTGNLVLSENSRGADPGPALWIVPDHVPDGVALLAVTGNVVQGRSNLGSLMRAGIQPPQTWMLYNAMPA